MGKVVAVIGQIASGKTTLAKYMSENGFERIVPYTTRPKRDGEKHGADYWFISSDAFAYYSERGYFAEETSYEADFSHVRYGTFKESLETPDDVSKILVLNPKGVTQLKDAGYDIFVVCLDMPQEVLMRRALRRGDSPTEIGRRIAEDERLFRQIENAGFVNLRVSNPELLPNQIAELIRAAL